MNMVSVTLVTLIFLVFITVVLIRVGRLIYPDRYSPSTPRECSSS